MIVTYTYVDKTNGGIFDFREEYTDIIVPVKMYEKLKKDLGGRVNRIYQDTMEKEAQHVGWVFTKKVPKSYDGPAWIQEVWVSFYVDPIPQSYIDPMTGRVI